MKCEHLTLEHKYQSRPKLLRAVSIVPAWSEGGKEDILGWVWVPELEEGQERCGWRSWRRVEDMEKGGGAGEG